MTTVDPSEVAILTVHGHGREYGGAFAQRFPWERLQLDQLRKNTPSGYTVLAYGNRLPEDHAATLQAAPEVRYLSSEGRSWGEWNHVWPLRNWLVRQAESEFRYLVTLDSDAFPVRNGWLERTISYLDESRPVAAVQRLENNDTHSDRCFMVFSSDSWRLHRFDFSPVDVKDAGAGISRLLEDRGLDWRPLTRTNAWNPHPLIAAIYDHDVYHHAAGSRRPRFRSNKHIQKQPHLWRQEIALHVALLDQLFEHPQHFFDRLEGAAEPLAREWLVARGLQLIEDDPDLLGPTPSDAAT